MALRKKAWLKQSKERTTRKIEEKERATKARGAIAEGKCPAWNKEAERKSKTPIRKTRRPGTKKTSRTQQETATQKNPWDTTYGRPSRKHGFREASERAGGVRRDCTANAATTRPRLTTVELKYRQAMTSNGSRLPPPARPPSMDEATKKDRRKERQRRRQNREPNEKAQRERRRRPGRAMTRTSLTMWCRSPGR